MSDEELERSFRYGWHQGMDTYRQRLLGKLRPHMHRENGDAFLTIEWRELLEILRGIK